MLVNCVVYAKKGCYSTKREADIVVDISVECALPGEPRPYLYLMIECKDYSGTVPASDLEEFESKLGQIAGLNTKAIFLTTARLQEGAVNFANSSGMRVMRFNQDGRIEVLSFRQDRTVVNHGTARFANAVIGLSSEGPSANNFRFVGIGPMATYFDLFSLIGHALTAKQ